MTEKCKYCELDCENEFIISEPLMSDKGQMLLLLSGSLIPTDNGGQELNVALLDSGGEALIDFKTSANYCPFCGRKLSKRR